MTLNIKKNVQRLLNSKGWSIYHLSKRSGVSLTALYSLDKKKSGPTTETLVKIADALEVSIDELVRGKA